MLRVESVSKRFRGGNYGVRDLSISLDGGVLGLLGPNGAGKTTLMQMLATITRPTAGRIFFGDIDVVAEPDELRRRLGYLPQDFGVYDNLTALEFLICRCSSTIRRAWWGSCRGPRELQPSDVHD